MMKVDPDTDLTNKEIEEFARLLGDGPAPRCQVRPEFHGDAECEVEVTHMLRTCKGQGLACIQAIREVQKSVRAGCICAACQTPVATDWRYVPI